jgi:predicted XRE-type DNA-binding protein
MANKKTMTSFKSAEELAHSFGFTKAEAEIIAMKGAVIGLLDKERERRGFNNTKFAEFLGIPKSRWSSIFSSPEKVTLDYLLTLAAKCGALYKLTRKAA